MGWAGTGAGAGGAGAGGIGGGAMATGAGAVLGPGMAHKLVRYSGILMGLPVVIMLRSHCGYES